MDDVLRPTITTVIPTYRRPKLLKRAIRSVLAQTYSHIQICVYDNASGDETASVVAEISQNDPRVKYHCHFENIGAAKNFIYAAEHVETPYFSFLSDDDVLLPEFYETALMGFREHPESIFSATATISMNTQSKTLSIPLLAWKPGFYQPPQGLLTMLKYSHPIWTGVLYRKEVISKIGTDFIGSDMSFGLLAAAHLPFTISLKPGAIFVIHASSGLVTTKFQLPWIPIWVKLVKKLCDDKKIPSDVRAYAKEVLERRIQRHLLVTGMAAIFQDHPEAVDDVLKTFRELYPGDHRACLIVLAKHAFRYLPPIKYVVLFLLTLRRALRRLRGVLHRKETRQKQKEFEHYAEYLKK